MKLQIGIDGKNYEVEVEVLEDDESPRHPNFGPYHPFQATVPSSAAPIRQGAATVEPQNLPEGKISRSPVAGVVIKVNVKPGQQIKANDLLIVLEAMKMETNVAAAMDGKVKAVRVTQGDSVKVNQVVVEFE
ncbi:MAG TPA: biotin/lipoyl-containing protein [Terriglobales bacterium]|nr:biotin/lipoyl-containing protein [Terriglobales bacterium]